MADAEAMGISRILRMGPVNSFDSPVSAAYGLIRFVAGFNLGFAGSLSRVYESIQKTRKIRVSALAFVLFMSMGLLHSRKDAAQARSFPDQYFRPCLCLYFYLSGGYGDVFGHIGFLIAAFMSGAACASCFSSGWIEERRTGFRQYDAYSAPRL